MLPLILWLNAQSSDSTSSLLTKLEPIQTFTQPIECIQYIQNHRDQSIFLVVPSSFAKQVVPQAFHYSNLVKMVLFCTSSSFDTDRTINYGDKLMIFDQEDALLERLWNDLSSFFQEEARQCFQLADEFKQRAKRFKQSPCG